jgi:membrane protease YdiL (CAAX protease family)
VAADAAGAPNLVAFLLGLAGLWGALLGSCWIASRRYGTGHLARDYGLRLTAKDASWGLLVSIVARIAGVLFLIPIVVLLPEVFDDNNLNGYERVAENDLAVAIALAVVATLGAPLVEELFFRGLLQNSLVTTVGATGAIALQAVLFGLAHFSPLLGLGNVITLTVITVGGVVFGVAARWRGLGTSVMAHMFFNVLAIGLLFAA